VRGRGNGEAMLKRQAKITAVLSGLIALFGAAGAICTAWIGIWVAAGLLAWAAAFGGYGVWVSLSLLGTLKDIREERLNR
jgi:hypothetical protein